MNAPALIPPNPLDVPVVLTLEQRVCHLEKQMAKMALAVHNQQYAKHGSPRNKAGTTLAELILREGERVVAESKL